MYQCVVWDYIGILSPAHSILHLPDNKKHYHNKTFIGTDKADFFQ